MGIESFLIASSVLGVVGQRLLRRNCEKCLKAYKPSAEELAFYEESRRHSRRRSSTRATGCNFCSNTGFSDRIGVYELLTITPEIKRLVVGWATQDELRRMAVKQGMRTLQRRGDRAGRAGPHDHPRSHPPHLLGLRSADMSVH